MKISFSVLFLGILFLLLNACDENTDINPKPQSVSINKIMALGASRVEGARPDFESFRYELWIDLVDGGWTFDYTGTQTDNASYPEYNGTEFDPDHEGRGGWTSGEILSGMDAWLSQTGSPDIVLFSSPSGNDALTGLSYEQAVSNINAIVDVLQADNPEVIIIIEQMAPGRSDFMNAEQNEFFEQMQQEVVSIAENQTTSSSQVIVVDMFSGFNDSYLADDVHYNEAGAIFVADRYYEVLENVLEE